MYLRYTTEDDSSFEEVHTSDTASVRDHNKANKYPYASTKNLNNPQAAYSPCGSGERDRLKRVYVGLVLLHPKE